MLATLSSSNTSAGREICSPGSNLTHTIQRPTSFLIRDILGKCSDPATSDSDEHHDRETSKRLYDDQREQDDQESTSNGNLKSPSLPTLCCRECISGQSRNQESQSDFSASLTKVTSYEADHKERSSLAECRRRLIHDSELEKQEKEEESDISKRFEEKGKSLHRLTQQNLLKYNSSMAATKARESLVGSKDSDSSSNEEVVETTVLSRGPFPNPQSGDEEWKNKHNYQQKSSPVSKLYQDQELQRSVIDKLRSTYGQQYFYNGLYAGAQNLIDLNYALNLRAASALGIQQLSLPFMSAYRNAQLQNESTYNTAKQERKIESRQNEIRNQRFDPYPRYRLLEWSQGRNLSSRDTSRSVLSHHRDFNTEIYPRRASVSPPTGNKHDTQSSIQPPSPSFSDQSQPSPLSSKRPIQLPAYFRSRLGGTPTAEDSNVANGKSKKCRRSRTVFTELQVTI